MSVAKFAQIAPKLAYLISKALETHLWSLKVIALSNRKLWSIEDFFFFLNHLKINRDSYDFSFSSAGRIHQKYTI